MLGDGEVEGEKDGRVFETELLCVCALTLCTQKTATNKARSRTFMLAQEKN